MPKASLCLLLLSAVFLSSDANAKLKDWHHYTSDNFSIYTDVRERKAMNLIKEPLTNSDVPLASRAARNQGALAKA